MYSFQNLPSCTTQSQQECHQKISLDTYNCKKSCNGLLITSFSKIEFDKSLERHIPKALNAYRKYKKMFQYNPIMEGIKHLKVFIISTFPFFLFSEYVWENKLRYVRIYFDTPTFDRITKDRAAKFVDMLSAIGGTMGLLTGFSIISGVEILYYIFTISKSVLQNKKNCK